MNRVVDLALKNLESAIEESGAQIITGQLPVVEGNQEQLVSLFQNLIGNAIKYRSAAPPVIHIDAKHAKAKWIFSLSDNGIGIDPKYSVQIFSLFKRLHGSNIPGAGMGLAISKRVVELHGGRIWAEPRIGPGSQFSFTIWETRVGDPKQIVD